MAGYVTCHGTPTKFDETLDRLTVDLGIVEVNRFGADATSPTALTRMPLTRSIHDGCPTSGFYRAQQNPDFRLYEMIDSAGAGVTSLYFTDGVQSDVSITNSSPSVARLAKWLSSGKALAILALRSQFNGRAWSESKQGWMGNAAIANRPFYVFVFAPNEASLDAMFGKISKDLLDSATVIRFRPDGVACDIDFKGIAAFDVDEGTPWVMFGVPETTQFKNTSGAIGSYACSARSDYPVATVVPVMGPVRYARWSGASMSVASGGLPAGAAFAVDAMAKGRAPIRGAFGDDPTTRFGTFTVPLSPTAGSLKPSVLSLSTDSDADLAAYDRTYRFSWLVEQLARDQVARIVAPRAVSITTYYR